MKKNNLAEFFKSKSFYALLCVGALAIVVIAMVGLNQSTDKGKSNNLVDLNDSQSNVAQSQDMSNQDIAAVPDTNNTTSSATANNETGNSKTEVAQGDTDNQSKSGQAVTDGSLLEFDAEEDAEAEQSKDDTKKASSKTANATNDKKASDKTVTAASEKATTKAAKTEKQEDSKAVMSMDSLHFKTDKGLLWPVSGNVLMDYSADRVTYFATLEQFKCNPAIIIDAEVGTEVLSAADGVIASVEEEDETGLTVTVTIGDGYNLVYGQLKDVTVEAGDTIKEGTEIGKVADPSKFYTVEGSNLYFQVLKDDESVNPMEFLR